MKSILLGAAVAGMLMVSAPTQSVAQGFYFGGGPSLSPAVWLAKRERAFSIFNPLGADAAVPPSARPLIGILNRVVFGASGISKVSRFFGIRG